MFDFISCVLLYRKTKCSPSPPSRAYKSSHPQNFKKNHAFSSKKDKTPQENKTLQNPVQQYSCTIQITNLFLASCYFIFHFFRQ